MRLLLSRFTDLFFHVYSQRPPERAATAFNNSHYTNPSTQPLNLRPTHSCMTISLSCLSPTVCDWTRSARPRSLCKTHHLLHHVRSLARIFSGWCVCATYISYAFPLCMRSSEMDQSASSILVIIIRPFTDTYRPTPPTQCLSMYLLANNAP